jgi:DNA-binding NtrC family response regulator
MNMPFLDGKALLGLIQERHPEVTVCLVTAVNEVREAVSCMQAGAYDYVVKPLSEDQLLATVRKALEHRGLTGEAEALKRGLIEGTLRRPEFFAAFTTRSENMLRTFQYVEAMAPTPFPVLITGETGSGKELMAKAVHDASARPGRFVAVNAAGIDDLVFSDTLFGHVKGAFTGADRERPGLLEEANNGTLFLDEMGDLRPESQVKLLRLLQEGTYLPLGSDRPKTSTARIVVATHRQLRQRVREGLFRQDLFFRLQTHEIQLPSLRERSEDLPLLARACVEEAATQLGKPIPHIPPELFPLLATYPFPGNIRELRGLLADAVSRHTAGATLGLVSLREKLALARKELSDSTVYGDESGEPWETGVGLNPTPEKMQDGSPSPGIFPEVLPSAEEWEQLLIHEAVRRAGGNRTLAASLIGLARQTIIKRLKG